MSFPLTHYEEINGTFLPSQKVLGIDQHVFACVNG